MDFDTWFKQMFGEQPASLATVDMLYQDFQRSQAMLEMVKKTLEDRLAWERAREAAIAAWNVQK